MVAHDEEAAQAKTQARRQQIEKLIAQADQWCDKLEQQEDGQKGEAARSLSRYYRTFLPGGQRGGNGAYYRY